MGNVINRSDELAWAVNRIAHLSLDVAGRDAVIETLTDELREAKRMQDAYRQAYEALGAALDAEVAESKRFFNEQKVKIDEIRDALAQVEAIMRPMLARPLLLIQDDFYRVHVCRFCGAGHPYQAMLRHFDGCVIKPVVASEETPT